MKEIKINITKLVVDSIESTLYETITILLQNRILNTINKLVFSISVVFSNAKIRTLMGRSY